MGNQKWVESILKECLTVGDLKEQLEAFDDETPVIFEYNYGDHWNSPVCEPIRVCEESPVGYSDYHRMLKRVEDPDISYDQKVIILSK